jgi:hypothetical protein
MNEEKKEGRIKIIYKQLFSIHEFDVPFHINS